MTRATLLTCLALALLAACAHPAPVAAPHHARPLSERKVADTLPPTTTTHAPPMRASRGTGRVGPTTIGPQLRSSLRQTAGRDAWWPLISAYDWPDATAMAVMWCESRGDANAHNPSGANGLFQIIGGPFDPAANVATAYRKWRARGWQPWVSSAGCWS